MIYFTTFIFTLLLARIARAVPACGDVASPEDMYDPMYDDEQPMFATYPVTWNSKYGNPNGNTSTLACSSLAALYPHFRNIPGWPYIGAAFNIQGHESPNCGKCWKLINPTTHKFIYFTAIDTAKSGFVLSKPAFVALGGGTSATLQVEAEQVPARFCGLRSKN
jgi:hypothetical protein